MSSDNGGREDADVQNARKEAICSSARATSLSGRCTLNDAARLVNAVNGAEGGSRGTLRVANENVGERRSFMAKQSILLFPLAQIPTATALY